MSGLVDGVNSTFQTQYAPVLTSGSVTVYNASGSVVAVSSIDYSTGEVGLDSAPNYQPLATYTYTPYTAYQINQFLMAGFDEMMGRWVRDNWYLSSSGSVLTFPTEDDVSIYVAYKNPATNELSDPLCSGSIGFSLLRSQVNFYMACCEYAYISRQLMFTAETSVSFREARGGSLDRQKIPENIELALKHAEAKLILALKRAQDQYYPNEIGRAHV